MSVPKSIIKIQRNGNVKFISNVDAVQYTLKELTRGALRDVGKLMRSQYRRTFHLMLHRRSGLAGAALQYWVRPKEADLQLGLWKDPSKKPAKGFWGGFYEIGNSQYNIPKMNIMETTVERNISKIIEIEEKYLGELSKEKPNLSGLNEGEYMNEE